MTFLLAIGVLEVILLLAIGCTAPLFIPEQHDQAPTSSSKQQEEQLADHLSSTDKEIAHLEQSVVIMLGFTALTLAILFGSIAFGEYRINRAVEDLQNRAEEVKLRFPRLAEMEDQARRALGELEDMFSEEEWLSDRYAELEIGRRQHILTVEHLIALEFAGPSTPPQLRGMANFYFSKFTTERLASDLDRALYYALLASSRGGEKFQYKNDLGPIYMDLADRDPKYRIQARKHCWTRKTRSRNSSDAITTLAGCITTSRRSRGSEAIQTLPGSCWCRRAMKQRKR
jgi:cell division protein FtsL